MSLDAGSGPDDGARRSADGDEGSDGGESTSPGDERKGRSTPRGRNSSPGEALRGTSGPCTTAILRLGTAFRCHSGDPSTAPAGVEPPSGPSMARPPASPFSGDRTPRWYCTTACESWEGLDVAGLSLLGPWRASRAPCVGRQVSGLRRRSRGRTHRREHGHHRHHSRRAGIALVVAHTHAPPLEPPSQQQNATDLQTTLSADVIGKPVSGGGRRGKGSLRWK